MSRRFTWVFLDVGTTLVDPHPSFHELAARICRAHGHAVTAADVEAAEPRVWHELRAREERGERYGLTREEANRFWHDVYHIFMRELGVEQPGEVPVRLYEEFLRLENWALYPDALPTLHELERRGYRLGVVSNWEDWLEELLISLEVAHLFQFAVVSGVEMVAKPDPGIYRRALELSGADPREVVHVGDSVENDVRPASEVGITAVLLDRRDRWDGRHEPRITSLSQLPDLLEHLPASTSHPQGEGAAPDGA
jgi:REG-2-like HAD superfamily hydrolase